MTGPLMPKPGSRPHDVLELLIKGLSNAQIGSELGISHRTVEIHRAKLYKLLGTRNAQEAVALYLQKRIIELERENECLLEILKRSGIGVPKTESTSITSLAATTRSHTRGKSEA